MAYTSIKTTGGWSTNTVTAAYDLLFRWQLKSMPLMRQFVDVRPERVTHRGDSVTLQLNSYFAEADVAAAMTPLDEETDVTPTKLPATTPVTLTPAEYGFANLRTLKLKNRGMVDIDPVIGRAVGTHCGDVIDRLVQTAVRLGTQVQYSGNASSTVTIDATDNLGAKDIAKVVAKLRGKSVMPRDGQLFVTVAHPDVIHDLRRETGSGAWRVPNEYGQSQADIWSGEIGAFEGSRFVQSPTLLLPGDESDGAGGTVAVYRSFVFGREALAEAVVTEPHTVVSPQIDMLRRNTGLGWYGDLAFKIFRNEALYRIESASTIQ